MKRRIITAVVTGAFCVGVGLLADAALARGGKPKGPTLNGWSHLYVRALDARKTFHFYHKVLGMEFVGSKTDASKDKNNPKVYYYFRSGRVCVCVGAFPSTPSDYRPLRMSRLSLHWEVDHLGAVYERLRDQGYTDLTEPRTSKWGARTFTVYDPNGVAIGLTEWTGKSDWQQPNLLDHALPFAD